MCGKEQMGGRHINDLIQQQHFRWFHDLFEQDRKSREDKFLQAIRQGKLFEAIVL